MIALKRVKKRVVKSWLCLDWMATLLMEMNDEYALYDFLCGRVYFELGCERLNRDCNVGDAPWLNAGG